MADSTIQRFDRDDEREQWLIKRLSRLCTEDDFAGALDPLTSYPCFASRRLSVFEDDLRDWGFVYGLAFGIAVSEWPDESHEEIAKFVRPAALMVYRRWSGEIEDPVAKREMAIRELVRTYADVADRDDRDEQGRHVFPLKLQTAMFELVESARG